MDLAGPLSALATGASQESELSLRPCKVKWVFQPALGDTFAQLTFSGKVSCWGLASSLWGIHSASEFISGHWLC